MSVGFLGIQSALDRTIFVNNGPIMKYPTPILTGTNLFIVSDSIVEIKTGSFNDSFIGKILKIVGTPNGRNNGEFTILNVLNSTQLKLDSNLSIIDQPKTLNVICSCINNLKVSFNRHLSQVGVHGTNDASNLVTTQDCVDLKTGWVLFKDLKSKYLSHIINISYTPPVHKTPDNTNSLYQNGWETTETLILSINELVGAYNSHRQDLDFHVEKDITNKPPKKITPVTDSGELIGPHSWTVIDIRNGQIANDPSDVFVTINGLQVSVDAVFGTLGAIVLSKKPDIHDEIKVTYNYVNNPSYAFSELNSQEYVLNQINGSRSGIPGHEYRSSSYLINPEKSDTEILLPFDRHVVGWKYKGVEKAYSSVLNNENSLLLNIPYNKTFYEVNQEIVKEYNINYDAVILPQFAFDPWSFSGSGDITINNLQELKILDSSGDYFYDVNPPLYSHGIDIRYESRIIGAVRVRIDDETLKTDGVYTGVGFGIFDGYKVALVGFIKSKSNNLNSAIYMINQIVVNYNNHLSNPGVHFPNDDLNKINVTSAYDFESAKTITEILIEKYNNHLSYFDNGDVHIVKDSVNLITISQIENEQDLIFASNDLYDKFNSHISSPEYHYNVDTVNQVSLIKQVGILKSGCKQEEKDSWDSYPIDWTIPVSYILKRDEIGDVALYKTGEVSPIIQKTKDSLSSIDDVEIKIDIISQFFFGSTSKQAISESYWSFIKINVHPVDSLHIGRNKTVNYLASVTPDKDENYPWMTVGYSGYSSIKNNKLIIDSTSNASQQMNNDFGLLSGSYRGYVRYEPTIIPNSISICEFRMNSTYWTHGINNRSLGLFIDDGVFSTHLLFLQASLLPATCISTLVETYGVTVGDNLNVILEDGSKVNIVFTQNAFSAALVCDEINSQVGFNFASPFTKEGNIYVKLSSNGIGSNAKFVIVDGTITTKVGLNPGSYFGFDTDPETEVAWFGESFPEFSSPAWTVFGDEKSEMMERILRITDLSQTDFKAYNFSDVNYTKNAISSSKDWKLDSKLSVLSYQVGNSVYPPEGDTGSGLRFCGVLFNIDEGYDGKNLDFHLSLSLNDLPYIGIYSYNSTTGFLNTISEIPFIWNDGKEHVYNIFTSKNADLIFIYADDALLSTITYSSLNTGSGQPNCSFGSGSNPISNADLRTAKSIVDWRSFSIFSDKKLQNPESPNQRYVGIYLGGDPEKLSSYRTCAVDWSIMNSYKLVRDPTSTISLFLNNNSVPSISVFYDGLNLPPVQNSFLNKISEKSNVIAFGCFNESAINRSSWEYVKYSIGVITSNDEVVPQYNVLNRVNFIASPEHLDSNYSHVHKATTVWSGGTPNDEFLSDSSLESYTILNYGTPPVPMTQDLGSRGGLVKSVTPIDSILSPDVLHSNSSFSSYFDDEQLSLNASGILSYSDSVSSLCSLSNDIKLKYNNHVSSLSYHLFADTGVSLPDSTDLTSCINLVNDIKTKFNTHILSTAFHKNGDSANIILSPDASGFSSCVNLLNEIKTNFNNHIKLSLFHEAYDLINLIVDPTSVLTFSKTCDLLNEIKTQYNKHIIGVGLHSNTSNSIVSPNAVDQTSAFNLASEINTRINTHFIEYHQLNDNQNTFSYSLVNDEDSITIFSQLAKVAFNKHVINLGSHGKDDTDLYSILNSIPDVILSPFGTYNSSVVIPTLQQIAVAFNSHLNVVGVHKNKDIVNVFSAEAPVTSVDIANYSNNLKYKINSHFGFNGHVVFDSNSITGESTYGADHYVSTVNLINEIKLKLKLHATKQADNPTIINQLPVYIHVHGMNDNSSVLNKSLPLLLVETANSFQQIYNKHLIQSGVHIQNDLRNQFYNQIVYSSGIYESVNYENLYDFLLNLSEKIDNHYMNSDYHISADLFDTNSLPKPLSISEAITFLTDRIQKYNSVSPLSGHLNGVSSHKSPDTIDVVTTSEVSDFYSYSALKINKIKQNFNIHINKYDSHVITDPGDSITFTDLPSTATESDLSDMINAVNEIREKYESHRLKSECHIHIDTVNIITSPEATNLDSFINLFNNILFAVDSHGTQTKVHGSAVVLKLVYPDDRIIYDSMDFFKTESGSEETEESCISDDESTFQGILNNLDSYESSIIKI